MFCKIGVLRNFAKFTGKDLRQSIFLNKVADLRPATLLKKKSWHRGLQKHFVNIANVSLEKFLYVLYLNVTYTLTLLKGGLKLLYSCLVVWPILMYIKQCMNFYVLMISVFIYIVRWLESSDIIVSVF